MRNRSFRTTSPRCRTLLFLAVSLLGAAPAGAAVWKGYGLHGAVAYFSSPTQACEYQFDQIYRPTYSGHALAAVEELHDFFGRLASVQCTWHDTDGMITPILYTDATLSCSVGIPVFNEPWCLPPLPIADRCPDRGNPIAVMTGNKVQRERDFATADGKLYFERTYSSGGLSRGRLGRRWRTSFDRNLIKPSKTGLATLELGDGRIARFYNTGSSNSPVFYPARPMLSGGAWTGQWTASSTNYRTDESWSLAKSGTNWVFTDEDGTVEIYDASFRVTSITFPGGYSWTYVAGGILFGAGREAWNQYNEYGAVCDGWRIAAQGAVGGFSGWFGAGINALRGAPLAANLLGHAVNGMKFGLIGFGVDRVMNPRPATPHDVFSAAGEGALGSVRRQVIKRGIKEIRRRL